MFGLLAVELALELSSGVRIGAATIFGVISMVFAWRSFYAMQIEPAGGGDEAMRAIEPGAVMAAAGD